MADGEIRGDDIRGVVAESTGVVEEMEREAGITVPAPRSREPSQPPRITSGGVLRLLVFVALAAFLLYYVGPRDLSQTTLKVALAVVFTGALWVGANLLFDQAYDHWTRFNTIIGAALGFVAYFVADSNGSLRTIVDNPVRPFGTGLIEAVTGWSTRPFDFNSLLWGLIGGAALGLVMFLLSAPRQQLARLPMAVVGFTAFGLLTAFALDDSVYPALDWGKLLVCTVVALVVFGLVGLWRQGRAAAPLSVLTGVAVGWLLGAWGGADIGAGNVGEALVATVVPAAAFGVRFGLAPEPDARKRRRIDQRSRSWIFVTPALAFITVGLVGPLVRTLYLSFHNRNGEKSVGLDNYHTIFTSKNFINTTNWQNIFTSRLFYLALALLALGIIIGVLAGRRTSQPFERAPSSVGPILAALFVLTCAVFASIRGTIMNNIWWVIVVTSLATALGLAVAVLADRAKAENTAKSLIFLPMAISFIGAGIIWRFMYQARDPSQNQTGVMNAVWVWIGQSTNSTGSEVIWLVVLFALAVFFAWFVKKGVDAKAGTTAGFAAGFLLLDAYLIYRILGPGLGGYSVQDGVVTPQPVLFIQEGPFNNMWLMVVLIWVQTGFAMVILSAAIKAVPTELTEAAKVDGATESQVFWRITLPQIGPTIGVVVTALFVTVMKVFDIVYAMTNGNFGTQVIANQMWITAFGQSNLGLGSALAVVLFAFVIPVMWINIRRMQRERVA
jgi:alpha-glucoside transport system permease protein